MIRATLAIFSITVLLLSSLFAEQGVSLDPSYPGAYKPLFDEIPQGSPLTTLRPDLLDTIKPTFAKDTLIIDFESRNVTFSRFDTLTGYPLWEFHYSELGDYLQSMEKHTSYALSKKILIEQGKKKKSESDPKLLLALPHLPAWATRILGKEPPQLSITGSQKIKLGYQSNRVGIGGIIDTTQTNKEMIFKPTSNFLIRGSVGRLLKLEIRMSGATGEEVWDSGQKQLENIKIEYKEEVAGELEDDVIQEVVVGKTNFNMPGQGLAGYSTGSNDGLFGIKIRSQVGPLSLTTIASIEQTEKQTKTIDLTATSTPKKVGESEMEENLFFFLDEVYRLKYLALFSDPRYYQEYLAGKKWTSSPEIKTVEVYRKIPGTVKPSNTGKVYEWATYKPYRKQGDQVNTTDTVTSLFEKLKLGDDYHYNYETGMINFTQGLLNDNDLVAIYCVGTDTTKLKKGNMKYVSDVVSNKPISKIERLWVLKNPKNDQVLGDSTYDLTMRNVYSLSSNSGTPDFSIKRVVGPNDEREKNDAGVYYASIMGLMDNNNNFTTNENIFDLEQRVVLIPPYKRNLGDSLHNRTLMEPFSNPALGMTGGEQNFGNTIYNQSNTTSWTDKFTMITTKKEKTTSFTLDFGVQEESETIKGDGVLLVRNEDYTIDYGMGFVDLISTNAKSATRIDAEYQKASLFFLDKKVFLGVNGKVNLPGIGRNSYFGTTLMWQLMDTKSMMPKVGTEPFDRFLFDANLELDFEPAWMTALVNMIPLISSDAASSARFSFEIARSKTASSTKTGDAYIDNFSTSSRTYTLGTEHRSWSQASPSFNWTSESEWYENPPAWSQYWIQPVGSERIRDTQIFPPKVDVNGHEKTDASYISTLRLVVQPYPEDSTLRAGVATLDSAGKMFSKVNPWTGIMRGFSGSLNDRRNDRYFEFWVRSPSWKKGSLPKEGELIVDLGQVTEDFSLDGGSPNRDADYEVVSEALTPDNDLGIDGKKDDEESWLYPNLSVVPYIVETMKLGDPKLGEKWKNDPARDNFKNYVIRELGNAAYANGSQENLTIKTTPDNEDVSGDGTVTLGEGNYFRYKIDLKDVKNSPYISKSDTANSPDEGWVKIRIPVGDNATPDMYETFRQPNWKSIEHVRFLWHNFDPAIINEPGYQDTLEFHALQFVGNQWRELVTDSTSVGRVTATIEDSRNTAGYRRPPEKRIETSGGTEQVTDYSLVLEFEGVERDSLALVYREFSGSQTMDLTNYEDIRFWVEDLGREISTSRNNWFVFRFGSNDSTYYEYKTRRVIDDTGYVYDNIGWNSSDGFIINMAKFAELKNNWFDRHGERSPVVDTSFVDERGDILRIFAKTQQMPTASAIRWIGFGVENRGGTDYNSRVRINGLRSTGLANREGWAVRSGIDLGFSDFIKTNVNFKYTDADFRSMSQEVHAKGVTAMSGGVSGSVQLAKFLPSRAGVQLPLGAGINSSIQRPETRQNSDISLRQESGSADGFRDLTGDYANLIFGNSIDSARTKAAEYQQLSKDYKIYTSYNKAVQSEKSLVNLTLDRIGTNYSYSVTDNTTRLGQIPTSESILVTGTKDYHISMNESKKHDFGFNYDLSPTKRFKDSTSWAPFKNAKNKQLNRKIKGMTLNPVPQKVTLDLIKVNYSHDTTYNSTFEVTDSNYKFTSTEQLGITHKAEVNYKPIDPFTSINLTVNSKRDFDSYLKTWGKSGVDEFVKHGLVQLDPTWRNYGVLNMENSREHATSFQFTPDLLSWLYPDAKISSNYSQGLDITSDTVLMRGNLSSKFDLDTKLRVRKLFEDLGKIGKGDNGFNKSMKAIAGGMDKIDFESIDFDYGSNMVVGASYLDTQYVNSRLGNSAPSYYAWTLGFQDRSFGDIVRGTMDDQKNFGGVQNRNGWYKEGQSQRNSGDKRGTNQTFNVRTGIKVPDPVDFNIDNISLRWSRNYSVYQKYGKMDTTITWPEFKVSGTSPVLKKLPAIATYFSNMNVKTGYVYSEKSERSSDYFVAKDSTASDVKQNLTFRYGLDPLIKLDGVMKKRKIDMSYSLSIMFDTTIGSIERAVKDTVGVWNWQEQLQSGRKDVTSNHVWSAGYKVPGRSGRTLKLFRSRVIEFKGDTRYSLSIDYMKKKNIKYDHTQIDETTGVTPQVTPWDDKSFKLAPKVEYDVTKNIGLLLYYDFTKSIKDPEEKENKHSEFAGELTISF